MSTVGGENLRNIHERLIKYRPKFRAVKSGEFEGLGESKILPDININAYNDVLRKQLINNQALVSASKLAREAGKELANYCLAEREKFKEDYVIEENTLNNPEANDLLAYAASLIRMVYQCVALDFNVSDSRDRRKFSEKELKEKIYFKELAERLKLVVLKPILQEFQTVMRKAGSSEALVKTIINSLIRVVDNDKDCKDYGMIDSQTHKPMSVAGLFKGFLRWELDFISEEPACAAI